MSLAGSQPLGQDRILVVFHEERSSAGRVGRMLEDRGYILDVVRPHAGDALPASTEGYSGVVIFGGNSSVHDDADHIRAEIDWLKVPLGAGTPVFGICLGAQMLALHLGGRVERHPDGAAEIGYYDVTPTDAGRALIDWPAKVYQWHEEGFTLPSSATLLACGDLFEAQAFRYGDAAFGVQFHPELTLAMMHRWTVRLRDGFARPGALPRARHFSDRALYDDAMRLWLTGFLDLWPGGARRS